MMLAPFLYAVACFAALPLTLSPAFASPLWVLTSPRYVSAYFNVSLLDPLTGELSHSSALNLGNIGADFMQFVGNGVFAAATSSFMVPMAHYTGTSGNNVQQWLYFNTASEQLDRVGSVTSGPTNGAFGCSVRDEVHAITWTLVFPYSSLNLTTDTVTAQVWQYNDSPLASFMFLFLPSLQLSLSFDAYHPPSASCAFNQKQRLLYVQMNGAVPLLHTIDLSGGRVLSSTPYPGHINGMRTGCYGLAYSDKRQQLYSYLTDDGGLTPLAVQLVDPLTGINLTLIEGSELNATWANQNTFDDETGYWFVADAQMGQVYTLLSPSTGTVFKNGYINSAFQTVWATAYAYTTPAMQSKAEAAITTKESLERDETAPMDAKGGWANLAAQRRWVNSRQKQRTTPLQLE